jgi:hypothetical protein
MKKRKGVPQAQRPRWTPFLKAQQVDANGEIGQVWQNSLYTVIVTMDLDAARAKLSIRRNDRAAIHDWRDRPLPHAVGEKVVPLGVEAPAAGGHTGGSPERRRARRAIRPCSRSGAAALCAWRYPRRSRRPWYGTRQ